MMASNIVKRPAQKLGKRKFWEVEKEKKKSETEKVDAPKNNICQATQTEIVEHNKNTQTEIVENSKNTQTEIVENRKNKKTKLNANNNANVNVLNEKSSEKKDDYYRQLLHGIEIRQRAYRYIFMWKHQRNDWKFEKLRQIWLLDNLMKADVISDKIFPDVVEYFASSKGRVREVLIEKTMRIIRKLEVEKDEEVKAQVVNSIIYKRARQILQTLESKKLV